MQEYFPDILDYNFTANVEKTFDDVAEGKLVWTKSLDSFYKSFHPSVENAEQRSEHKVGERQVGVDPVSGKPVFVKIGRFGPVAQIGSADDEEKPKFAPLRKTQSLETVTFEEVMDLFKLPRDLGEYEGKMMTVAVGRFGAYIKHDSKFYSLKKGDDPMEITESRAIELIEEKRQQEANKYILRFEAEDIDVCNGRFGPYIAHNGANYKIPKGTDPATLTVEQCKELIEKQGEKPVKKSSRATAKTAKKTASKK